MIINYNENANIAPDYIVTAICKKYAGISSAEILEDIRQGNNDIIPPMYSTIAEYYDYHKELIFKFAKWGAMEGLESLSDADAISLIHQVLDVQTKLEAPDKKEYFCLLIKSGSDFETALNKILE
ncbi:MAG: hypothetical protein QM689_12850 [Oscillospiraceae bacterium]